MPPVQTLDTQRVARWSKRLAESDHALWLLGVASFLETIIVPIPIELILIPYMNANQRRIWLIATVTLLGCMAAALVGYGVGLLLFDSLGQWVLQTFEYGDAYRTFTNWFNRYGFWAILAIGVIPIPFQVAMLTAGVAGYPLPLFVLAATIARGVRYYGLAVLVLVFGDAAKRLWQRHSKTTAFVAALVLVGVFFAVRSLSPAP